MSGFVVCYRKIWDHPLFKGRADRVGMFVWLLHNAVWKAQRFDVKGRTLDLERGQLCVSERQLAEAWGVGRQVVRTFLTRLEGEEAIKTAPAHNLTQSRTVITICNYDKYQAAPEGGNPTLTQSQPTKEQGNNSVLRTGAPRRDPSEVIFTDCLAVLSEAGVPQKQGRSVLGKWRKQHGDAAVIAAAGKAKREGAIDPVAFIEGVFRHDQKREVQSGDRLSAWGIRDHDAEDSPGNFSRGGDYRPAASRHAEDDLPGVFGNEAEEDGPMPERDLQAGRDRLELLALRA